LNYFDNLIKETKRKLQILNPELPSGKRVGGEEALTRPKKLFVSSDLEISDGQITISSGLKVIR